MCIIILYTNVNTNTKTFIATMYTAAHSTQCKRQITQRRKKGRESNEYIFFLSFCFADNVIAAYITEYWVIAEHKSYCACLLTLFKRRQTRFTYKIICVTLICANVFNVRFDWMQRFCSHNIQLFTSLCVFVSFFLYDFFCFFFFLLENSIKSFSVDCIESWTNSIQTHGCHLEH